MKAVALVSGGLDSGCMVDEFREEIVAAVYFDYGSKHKNQELKHAHKLCADREIQLIEIDVKNAFRFHNSALLKDVSVPISQSATDDVQKQTIVPFRNGIMLSIVIGIVDLMKADTILIGPHKEDAVIYPDCRPEFIAVMGQAIRTGTEMDISIVAPYILRPKRDYCSDAHIRGFDFNDTYSCYNGGDIHCGVCAACLGRKEALKGFDKTKYIK